MNIFSITQGHSTRVNITQGHSGPIQSPHKYKNLDLGNELRIFLNQNIIGNVVFFEFIFPFFFKSLFLNYEKFKRPFFEPSWLGNMG